MHRQDIPRDPLLDFVTEPKGVFFVGECDDFMSQWDAGKKFPAGFVMLRGLVCRVAQVAICGTAEDRAALRSNSSARVRELAARYGTDKRG